MKSVCIKTNNNRIVNYLIEEFSCLNSDNIIIKKKTFKIYDNIIVHYLALDSDSFFNTISSILSKTIIKFYEPYELKKELYSNYFYFSSSEKKRILALCKNEDSLLSPLSIDKFNSLYSSFYNYIQEHHSIVLSGFYNFRLSDYHKILNDILDNNVNNYLLEREYIEFINILKLYVNSNISKTSVIHLICLNKKFIILDENKNKIDFEKENTLNAKFLSDITFSQNDYILNYLLNILPRKIVIHIPSPLFEQDDFLNTLKLIFCNKIKTCTECNLCSIYKYLYIDTI